MRCRNSLLVALFSLLVAAGFAQMSKPGILKADELKHAVPSTFFFAGQVAPVQMRNSAGFRTADGKLVLAGLVDNSGYASDVAEKYQGFLITQVKLNIGGSDLAPGQYGFGFTKDGKFMVMDVAGTTTVSVPAQRDEQAARPVPLKIAEDGAGYRLWAGKNWVSCKAE
jgi:hypothetical protein